MNIIELLKIGLCPDPFSHSQYVNYLKRLFYTVNKL